MESKNPTKLIEEVEKEQQERGELAADALQWFLDGNVEELFPRGYVVGKLCEELNITEKEANRAISDTVGDIVDPVQQVVSQSEKYVGIIEYSAYENEGAYRYIDYDDVLGKRKRVVCAKCVAESDVDADVTHATEGEGSTSDNMSWGVLLDKVITHYEDAHTTAPKTVTPGASLLNGTTISGNTAFHQGNENSISHDSISGVSASDHHIKTTSASGLTDVSADSVSGAHHSRYSDSEARTAVDGANVSITGDADTVDGFEATELARPKNIAVLTSTDTSTDINTGSNVPIPFDKQLQVDAGFSHSNSTNPEQLTFNDAGTYKIIASLSFSGSGTRANPNVRLSLNGTILEPRGASGYMRNREGHDEASSDVFEVLTVNSGDTLRVETIASADNGNVTLRANESRLIVEQVSKTVARSDDADTVDGSHAVDFASDNHNNNQHSTNFLPESQKTTSTSEIGDIIARNDDTALGRNAGNGQSNETAIGFKAAQNNSANRVTATGNKAAQDNTAFGITAIGFNAARNNTRADVTATGRRAAQDNTAFALTATGAFAARFNTGVDVTATGFTAAQDNTGFGLTAAGYRAARFNTGTEVTATGHRAAKDNTGAQVTATGYDAAQNNDTFQVTATGYKAAKSNSGRRVTGIGHKAAFDNFGDKVTATGFEAAQNNSANRVTATGFRAAGSNTGDGVIAIGHKAAQFNSENDIMIITDRNSNRRMELDLSNGNLSIEGSLNQNASL